MELRQEILNVNLAYYVNTDLLLVIEKPLGAILQVDKQPSYDNNHGAEEVPDDPWIITWWLNLRIRLLIFAVYN